MAEKPLLTIVLEVDFNDYSELPKIIFEVVEELRLSYGIDVNLSIIPMLHQPYKYNANTPLTFEEGEDNLKDITELKRQLLNYIFNVIGKSREIRLLVSSGRLLVEEPPIIGQPAIVQL